MSAWKMSGILNQSQISINLRVLIEQEMKQTSSAHAFAVLFLGSLLSGCCISLPKLPPPAPCETEQLPILGTDCAVCYGDTGCCTKECLKTRPPRQVLYQYPLHHFGWSSYQRRYGSGEPAFGPELVLQIPTERRY